MKSIWIIGIALLFASCIYVDGDSMQVHFDDGVYVQGAVTASAPSDTLAARVLGSIYETGELVSVFGTCLNADDRPLTVPVQALFSSWYPNGTVSQTNISMQDVGGGYYLYTGHMENVSGTYLTRLQCYVDENNYAYAFGEWQNPNWVGRIGQVDSRTVDIQQYLGNITIQIGDLTLNLVEGFNITYDMIESVNATILGVEQNLSNQIYIVGQIANQSVDRTDSYLAELIKNLTSIVAPPVPGNPVDHTETFANPVYWDDWTIRVDAVDPFNPNKPLFYPDVLCYIETSLSPGYSPMTPTGNHFRYTEFISSANTLTWDVYCVWA